MATLRAVSSFLRVPARILDRLPELGARELKVYLALVGACDGWDRPTSAAAVAKVTGLDRRDVRRTIQRLEVLGLIESRWTRQRTDPRGSRSVGIVGSQARGRITPQTGGQITPQQGPPLILVPDPSRSPLPPGAGGTAAAVVDEHVEKEARALFEGKPRETRRALTRLGHGKPDDVVRFLRHQARHRDIRGARSPITVVCDPEEFAQWLDRTTTPPPPRMPDVARTTPPAGTPCPPSYLERLGRRRVSA